MSLPSTASRPTGLRRLTRHMGVLLWGQPVHCLSCGHQDGWTTTDTQRPKEPGGLVFYLCGSDGTCGCDCERRYGVPPEMARPDLDEARIV